MWRDERRRSCIRSQRVANVSRNTIEKFYPPLFLAPDTKFQSTNTMANTQDNTFTSAGAKSAISDDMKDLTRGEEDISHTVQGHKANLANPSKPCS